MIKRLVAPLPLPSWSPAFAQSAPPTLYLTLAELPGKYVGPAGHFPPIETPDRLLRIAAAGAEAATPR